jgi:hypothetical protein
MKSDEKAADERTSTASAETEVPVVGAYQEGSIESVGGRPSGRDETDRTGQAGRPPDVRRAEPEPNRDAFASSEVAAQSSDTEARPGRTRS